MEAVLREKEQRISLAWNGMRWYPRRLADGTKLPQEPSLDNHLLLLPLQRLSRTLPWRWKMHQGGH